MTSRTPATLACAALCTLALLAGCSSDSTDAPTDLPMTGETNTDQIIADERAEERSNVPENAPVNAGDPGNI